MNIGKLLGVVSPGLSATGLFGNGAQGVGGAMLGGMSPLLMALLHKDKKGGAPVMPARPQDAVNPAAPAAPAAPGVAPVNPADTAAAKRKQMGLRLLQLGGQFANPFGPQY